MESAYEAVVLSIIMSAVNVVSQFGKIWVEAQGLRESFMRYSMVGTLVPEP